MVLPRVLTAVLLAPLFLWALYLGQLPFMALVFLLSIAALWEFFRIAEEGGHATQGVWGLLAGAWVAVSLMVPGVRPGSPFFSQAPAFAVMSSLVVSVLREMVRRDKGLSMVRLGMTALGMVMIVWPLGYLGLLRDLRGIQGVFVDGGCWATVMLVTLVWTQDTAAYAVGLTLGKHRLSPAISPKKTWEGAAGGCAAGVLASLMLRELFMKDLFGRGEVIGLSFVLCVLAQVSDLAESLVKRCFGVKDSSALLPGHGGVLDRFDSFLLSTPFLYFYMISVGKVQ